MAAPLVRRLFTVAEYHKMAEAGILGEDDRVELLEGEIVAIAPIGDRHAGTLDHLAELLASRVQGRAQVRVQSPVRLGERSEPRPDLALLRRRADFYRTGHPGPADTLLVVEVVDTAGAYDREVKLPLYARHGIPEAWLVDLTRNVIEVYRDPGPTGYAASTTLAAGSRLAPQAFPDASLDVAAVLGLTANAG